MQCQTLSLCAFKIFMPHYLIISYFAYVSVLMGGEKENIEVM